MIKHIHRMVFNRSQSRFIMHQAQKVENQWAATPVMVYYIWFSKFFSAKNKDKQRKQKDDYKTSFKWIIPVSELLAR